MRYLMILLTFVISLNANYCIQVMTTNLSDKRSILTEASSSAYRSFQDLRVERRGNYYVLRVGNYRHYNDSQQDLYDLRNIKRDAYVRTCSFNPQDAIYIGNTNLRLPQPSEPSYNRNSSYQKTPVRESSYNRNNSYRSSQAREASYNRNNNYRSSQPRKTSYNRDNNYRPARTRESSYNRDNNYQERQPRRTSYNRNNDYGYSSRPQEEVRPEQKPEKLSDDCKKCFVPRYKDGLFDF